MRAHSIDAVERGVQHALSEIRGAIAQIEAGAYPQYDHNCRRDIGEWLDVLDRDRRRQVELGGAYEPVEIGLQLAYLPGAASLDDLRRWRQWVLIHHQRETL